MKNLKKLKGKISNEVFFYCIMLFIALKSMSQSNSDFVIYYDSLNNKCNIDNYVFKQVIENYNVNQTKYKVIEYDKNNTLLSEGYYKEKDAIIRDGWFTYYFKNGQKEYIEKYDNGMLIGSTTSWYDNGIKKLEGIYIKDSTNSYLDSKLKILQFWSKNGIPLVVNGYGYYYDSLSDNSYEFGKLINGNKDSIWCGYIDLLNIHYTETYSSGSFVNGISIDSTDLSYTYKEQQKTAEPLLGYEYFNKTILKNIKYKKSDLENIKQPNVIVHFTINLLGNIENIYIVKSQNKNIDEQIITALKNNTIKWLVEEYKGIKINKDYIYQFNL